MTKAAWIFFLVALAAFVAADHVLVGADGHGGFWWSPIPGFFSFFGFLGCVLLIVVGKALGHYWLQRREGYYDDASAE